MTSQRYYQLDTLRASLMLLGVVIHAAFIYVTDGTWIVADRDTHRFFDYLVFVIHVFRMPAFFLLSGYLFALLLQRQGCTKTLLRSRVIRLCAPLFLAGLILNVPQLWLFDWFGPEFRGATLASNGCDSAAEWYAGCWVLHLWFLVVLVYFLIVAVLMHGAQTLFVRLYGARIGLKLPGPESVLWPAPVIVLAFAAYAVQSIYWRGGGAVMDWAPLLNVPWFFQYLPFFLAGFVYQRFSKGVEAWNQVSVASAVSLCGTWFILLLWFEQSGLSRRDFIFLSRNTLLLYYAAAFQTVFTLIVIASRLRMPSAKNANALADTSYTIYLVHHLLVFLMGLWLSTSNLNIFVKFSLVLTVALSISYLFHRLLVSRVSLLRLVFNGRATIRG